MTPPGKLPHGTGENQRKDGYNGRIVDWLFEGFRDGEKKT